ncbi:uncharacterized protein CIMG_12806 [Coccidioides immitis RS]|uniref:Uncharacterized protein n=1 Tax=Coccidioides immitis (strain RS) TaxID=246410 RepID=A0A0D8JSA1_COCIM|nr:uncharacterized protein CIMG_12806 [Coccidioides immitis RS]KJF60215.1 hypothetical protein CIMG_12806 [Coccidioides immitis RS]
MLRNFHAHYGAIPNFESVRMPSAFKAPRSRLEPLEHAHLKVKLKREARQCRSHRLECPSRPSREEKAQIREVAPPSPTPLPHAAWPGLFSTASDNWFAAAWWCHLRRATPKLRFVTFEADRDPVPGEKLIRHIGLCNYHLWP